MPIAGVRKTLFPCGFLACFYYRTCEAAARSSLVCNYLIAGHTIRSLYGCGMKGHYLHPFTSMLSIYLAQCALSDRYTLLDSSEMGDIMVSPDYFFDF